MESRSVSLTALAMMLALFLAAAAGPAQCQPSSVADPGSSYKGHKACDPMCFVKCVMSGGDINCFGTCILQCLFPTTGGEPDRTDPQASCMADCAVPACAKLCTKAEPSPRERNFAWSLAETTAQT
ncbi:unnamed protein product [Linum tenue]|uniref:Uncharacterized protein n=1 Tax=Linum tenue TaxID=586396 RepID=A0AAV0KGP7_9ROSI|nr:unnamed protein product [Linum tenue]